MIWSPEPIETALQTVEGQRRMTAYLRRLELISEIAFLSSLAVMLSGWLVIAPEWQPLVRAIMPLGLSLTVMRRAWRFTFLMILLEIAAIPLFPGGSTWDVFFVLAAVPVTVATGWAYRTHKKAAWRWVGTVLAMGLSQYLIAQTYYPQPLHTLMIWSIRPMRLLAPWLGLNAWLGWIPQYWFLGFIADQVFWGTGIFLVLAFFAELVELPIAQVPFFGRWRMPKWVLWITAADLAALVVSQVVAHHVPVAIVEIFIVAMASYLVLGVNVLWRIGELSGLPKFYRVGLLGLWSLGSWVGMALLSLLGLYESIWNLRDYLLTLRRPM
ncbi:hypothetical protein [Sulfobacillus thermosulfidooxidans]|uniref:hypothetical protein n=1 Tax=Sulfobacillus thermosulfidooxidans TaxID=28034 RepID=UPI00042A4E90|nr:hypothetical protein [Sulfobacillus thermosulfidooxidans]